MRKFTKPDLPRENERRFWQGIRAGLSVDEAAVRGWRVVELGTQAVRQGWRGEPCGNRRASWSSLSAIRGTRRDHAIAGSRSRRASDRS